MIKKLLVVFYLILVSKIGFAQNTNQTMTKVVVRNVSTNYPAGSYVTQPMTHYRCGEKYGRSEEAVDSVMGIHGLIIVSEPDAWMINLIPKTGVHLIDHGPTFIFHDFIIPAQSGTSAEFKTFKSSLISQFEYGKEMEFLKKYKAEKISDHYELAIDDYKIEMSTKGETEIPYRLKIFKSKSQIVNLQYDEFKTDLPFDPLLFAPPPNIKISERN